MGLWSAVGGVTGSGFGLLLFVQLKKTFLSIKMKHFFLGKNCHLVSCLQLMEPNKIKKLYTATYL